MSRRPPAGHEHLARQRQGGIYQIDFTIDGKRVRESAGTKDLAAACTLAKSRYDQEWAIAKGLATASHEMTVSAACDAFVANVAVHTKYGTDGQRHHIAAMLALLPSALRMSDLTNPVVAQVVAKLRQDRAPATVNRHLTTLLSVTRYARDALGVRVGDWAMTNHRLPEPAGRSNHLSVAQARALLAEICPHARAPVLFDLLTGLRRGNVLDLKWEQTDLAMGRIFVRQKGDRPLSVSLVPQAIALLVQIEPDQKLRTGAVWRFGCPAVQCRCSQCLNPRKRGHPIRSIRTAFEAAVRSAGLPEGTRFHDLRHTYATWLLEESGDLQLVSKALGHANVQTTSRYAHVLPARQADVMARVAGNIAL